MKNKNIKIEKFAYFSLKTINFEVMKTIRNQLKYPICFQLPVFLQIGITNCRYSIFMQLQKEQRIDNKQKIS